MFQDIMSASSVLKLKQILKSRYGKGLELSFVQDSASLNGDSESTRLVKGTLHIPICSRGKFLALAKIPEANHLPESSQVAVTDVVRLILEPALDRFFQDQLDHEIETSIEPLHFVGAEETETGRDRNFEKNVLFIVSNHSERRHQIAVQIHEILGNWACLKWTDVRRQVQSVEDMNELGSVTLVIEEVRELSDFEKGLLDAWLISTHDESTPTLILGSSVISAGIKKDQVLPNRLAEAVSRHEIFGDLLPLKMQDMTETLELLLDKESILPHH